MDKQVLEFLKELAENNNREWFAINKNKFENARRIYSEFIDGILPAISSIDKNYSGLSADQTIFRIYRDVRFSKDKAPYKTNFGAYLVPGGKKSARAGYYLQLEPGNCFLAGGAYSPPPEVLKKIRSEVYYSIKEFKKITQTKEFVDAFGEVTGQKLLRPPVGFPADFEDIELLKFKDYILFSKISDSLVNSQKLAAHVIDLIKKMKPFNDFLNRAIEE